MGNFHVCFQLWALHADLIRLQPGSPDVPMCGPHQSDGNPTLDVTILPQVGLPPLCGQTTGYLLQGIRRLHTHKFIHQGNKGVEVPTLM